MQKLKLLAQDRNKNIKNSHTKMKNMYQILLQTKNWTLWAIFLGGDRFFG